MIASDLTPKAHATRNHILDTGHQLISRKGYAGVGLQEVLKSAHVPKGSFYHYFASKEAFGAALLERYIAEYGQRLSRLLDMDGTGRDRLLVFFNAWIEDPDHPGQPGWADKCLFVKLSAEVADMPGDMHDVLSQGINRLVQRIAQLIGDAQSDGSISTRAEPDILADMIFQMWLGSALMSKLTGSNAPMQRALSGTLALLDCPKIPA